MQKKVSVVSLNPWWNQAARWLALIGGVINPIAFVLTYTVAGFLRPGYSPIHQAISDLGVGSNGSLLDTLAVISGLLLIAFVVGFALSMRRVLTLGWRWFGSAFLGLRGLALVTTAIFTEAPSTVAIPFAGCHRQLRQHHERVHRDRAWTSPQLRVALVGHLLARRCSGDFGAGRSRVLGFHAEYTAGSGAVGWVDGMCGVS